MWQWNNIDGSATSKTKFGLTDGEYSWKIKGSCGTNALRRQLHLQKVYITPLVEKKYIYESLLNFKIYPNPSRDVFNLTFTLSEVNKLT